MNKYKINYVEIDADQNSIEIEYVREGSYVKNTVNGKLNHFIQTDNGPDLMEDMTDLLSDIIEVMKDM